MVMIEHVHNLDLQFDLLHKVVFHNFLFVNDFDGEDIFTNLVSYFVDFTKTSHTDITVREGLKIVFPALPFFVSENRWRKEQYPVLDIVYFIFEMWRDFDRLDDGLLLLLLAHI